MALVYLDTYALVEIEKGNPLFEKYVKQPFVITDLTLAEFFAKLLQTHNRATAEHWWSKLQAGVVHTPQDILKEAIGFRHDNRRTGISFFDAVGYTYARSQKIPFVTGDKEFVGRPGVEFVK